LLGIQYFLQASATVWRQQHGNRSALSAAAYPQDKKRENGMNGFTCQLRTASHLVGLSALVFLFAGPVSSDPIEVMLHERDLYGAEDIEAGNYARGVERLAARVGVETLSHSVRAPLMIDLCAGYTMLEDFESAQAYCDQAVESGWYSGLALNNRGALHVAKGDYESAIRDFNAAIDARGADRIARRNLDRIEAKVAALREPNDTAVAYVAPDVNVE